MLPLCHALFPEIVSMYYYIDHESNEEYVRVIKEWSIEESTGEFDICVTCDSNIVIVDDVMKILKNMYN